MDDNGVDHVRRARRRSRLIACLAVWAVALGVGLVGTGAVGGPAEPARAASAADFDPGMIISDAKFYDGAAMTQGEISSFLAARVPRCATGYVCLRDYVESTPARAGDARCTGLSASRLSAADIVYWVGRACGVSQEALLVLLEKEQGIVTDSTPSARQYRSATGYGCPDTADCDSAYYGFFNQVYNAARQFKVYQATPSRWNYQAGRSNRILWHPTASCGSSQVTIRNQATAGLYIYTPYQPNAAALRNLYGTGDSCSAYGNRNFWRLFTDWFGPTTDGPVSSFAKTASSGAVYLLVGSTKHPLPDWSVYLALQSLGPIATVSESRLASYATGRPASPLVRDPRSGEVALVEGGARHAFSSCGLVDAYGFACGGAVDLDATQLGRLPSGAPVSDYFVTAGSSAVYYLTESKRFPVESWSSLLALNGGRSPYVATMSASAASRWPVGRTIVAPGTLMKGPGAADQVFLADGLDRRIPVTATAVALDVGAAQQVRTVAASVVAGYSATSSALSPAVRCAGVIHLGSTAGLVRVGDAGGLPVTDLQGRTCDVLPRSGAAMPGAVLVKASSSSAVLVLQSGTARPLPDWRTAVAVAGTSRPVIAVVRDATLAAIPRGSAVLPVGALVKTASDAGVYLVDGTQRLVWVSDLAITDELGLRGITTVGADALGSLPRVMTPVGRVVTCAGAAYVGASGRLLPVAASAGHGLPVTALAAATCGGLPLGSGPALSQVLVKSPSGSSVQLVQAGQRRPVTSWDALVRLAGRPDPVILTMSDRALAGIAVGAPVG
ncbi:hypothetical protein [Clavibacter michiganensis]|uniref:hypothetical protein n=1 Tax=Clavibacter michiganensis TaxID=28447 RepID=UPI0015E20BDA|nr:hypothetical protein [Clavibacter michiganensis]